MKKFKLIHYTYSLFWIAFFFLLNIATTNAQVEEKQDITEKEIVTEEFIKEDLLEETESTEEMLLPEAIIEEDEILNIEESEESDEIELLIEDLDEIEMMKYYEEEEEIVLPEAIIEEAEILNLEEFEDPDEIELLIEDQDEIEMMKYYKEVEEKEEKTDSTKEDFSWKTDSKPSIALRAMGSTNGYGAELVFLFFPRLDLRFGYEALNLTFNTTFTIDEQEFDTEIDYKVGAFNIIADFYLARGLYIAGGVGINTFSPAAELEYSEAITYGDLELSPEEVGTLIIDFEPTNKLSPYLALGFGRTIGTKRKVAFSFELGAYYQGAIDINASGTNLLEETASDEYNLEGDFEEAIKEYKWLPVLRFGLSYKLAQFN